MKTMRHMIMMLAAIMANALFPVTAFCSDSGVRVTFDLNDGSGTFSTQNVEIGGFVQRPASDPVRDGHYFDAWYTAPSGGEEWEYAWNFNDDAAGNEDFALYARWVDLGTPAKRTPPVTFDYSDDPGGWILTIRSPLVKGGTPDLSPTIRLGKTYYTIGRDFQGATAADQAASLALVLGKILADDTLEDFRIGIPGNGQIALLKNNPEAADPPFMYTSFRPGNWWLDMSYNPDNPLAANNYREVREPDRIRPFSSWGERVKDGTFELIELGQPEPWFKVYSLPGKGTYAIVEPYYTQEVLSYLIVGDNKAVLLDTAMSYGNLRQAVLDIIAAEGLGIDINNADQFFVLNSHTDADHTLGNYQFRDVDFYVFAGPNNADPEAAGKDSLGGPERLAVSNDVPPINADEPGDDIMADLPAAFVAERAADNGAVGYGGAGTVTRPGVRPGIDRGTITGITLDQINDGYQFDLGGRTLRVVYTPGHTNDSVSLIDEGNKLVFTGDFYYSGPNYVYSASADLARYAESAE
ncbi:MAG: MBL fold metallo-hydrolase, partial [Planctomycetota bacterium]|nr:MBL fold metallo-hydrolase [Planctomycetota bacterium]